ncbi:MAG: hypothetical protein JWR72_3417 [Flavisolibacter sp.]|nr:hypothetical protein [Flavisolibacter sp.]
MVIGTIYVGLNFFNTTTRSFTHVSTKNGLPSSIVYSLKKDTGNYLWLTTDFGIYKFRRGTNRFTQYSVEPASINSAFKSTGFYQLKDGRWLTSTATEMICFNPVNAALKTNNEPKVEITGFSIFDSAVFVDPFLAKDKAVQLRYNQNFLTIEFGVLNISNIQHTGYYYQLSKIDNDLIYAGSKQFASYTGLPPGEYTFRVKAENGGSATGETSLTIVISPPFWRTWWANCYQELLWLC